MSRMFKNWEGMAWFFVVFIGISAVSRPCLRVKRCFAAGAGRSLGARCS
jgi:hypothetical protein